MKDVKKTTAYMKYIFKLTVARPSFVYLCIAVNIPLHQSQESGQEEANQICSESDPRPQHTTPLPEPLSVRLRNSDLSHCCQPRRCPHDCGTDLCSRQTHSLWSNWFVSVLYKRSSRVVDFWTAQDIFDLCWPPSHLGWGIFRQI